MSKFYEKLKRTRHDCNRLSVDLESVNAKLSYKENIVRLDPLIMRDLADRTGPNPFPTSIHVPLALLKWVTAELADRYSYQRIDDRLFIKGENFYIRILPIMLDFVTFQLVKGGIELTQ